LVNGSGAPYTNPVLALPPSRRQRLGLIESQKVPCATDRPRRLATAEHNKAAAVAIHRRLSAVTT
jgi:hypothetical protein